MATTRTCYEKNDISDGYYKVRFIENATGEWLVKSFHSEYLAKKFVNKLRYSKRCTLVSYPRFK